MEQNRGPEFFKPVGEVGAAQAEPSSSSHTQSGEASDASPDSVAAQKLWEDVRGFFLQLKPLFRSYLKYVHAYLALSSFEAQERLRLSAARLFVWICSVIMAFAGWIFLSMFLWRAAVTLTNEPAMGPLILVLTHGLAAYALWNSQKKLTL